MGHQMKFKVSTFSDLAPTSAASAQPIGTEPVQIHEEFWPFQSAAEVKAYEAETGVAWGYAKLLDVLEWRRNKLG